MKNIQLVSYIRADDPQLDLARDIQVKMYAFYNGGIIDGFRKKDIKKTGYNKTGEGEPEYFVCFPRVTSHQWNLWQETMPKFGLDKIESYKVLQIQSQESWLQKMGLKEIKEG